MYKWPISHSYVTLLECMLMTLFVVVSWLRLESINVWLHGIGCTWGRPDFQTWQHDNGKSTSNISSLTIRIWIPASQFYPILLEHKVWTLLDLLAASGEPLWQDWQTEYRRSTLAKSNRKVTDGVLIVLMICFMISHSFLVGYWGSLIHTDSRGPIPGPAGAQLVDIRAAVWFLFLSSSRRAGSGFGRIFWSWFLQFLP